MAAGEAMFSVNLRWLNGRWRWTVTCDHCREDLSDDYDDHHPVTFLRIAGIAELSASEPERADAVAQRWREAWDGAQKTGRPLIVDKDEFDIMQVRGTVLEKVIIEHAERCSPPSPEGR